MTNHNNLPFSHQEAMGEAQLAPETQRIFDAVAATDSELLATPETRRLVEIGAAYILEVTGKHGSPDAPAWYAGSADHTIMTYHNGESEIAHGHTSAGEHGVGVPRNVLVISAEINARAGHEVVSPLQRALLFASAAAHDVQQLCGRSVAVENGDEEQSANRLRETLLLSGHSEQIAEEGACYVMATMYDPTAGRHLIEYDGRSPQTVLGQQIMAAADLLSPATARGALGSMEWTLEEFGMDSKDRILHQELEAQNLRPEDIPNLGALLHFVDSSPTLKQRFTAALRGQAGWIESLSYSDSAIRQACGAGIDDMFPGRPQTAANLRILATRADHGATLYQLWKMAGAGSAY